MNCVTFEEHRAQFLRLDARAWELKAVQVEQLGDTNLALGCRLIAQRLDSEAADLIAKAKGGTK